MNELVFVLMLKAMTADRYQWPVPPRLEPPALSARTTEPAHAITTGEREALRRAIERLNRNSTGAVVWDEKVGLFVPEVTPVLRNPEVLHIPEVAR